MSHADMLELLDLEEEEDDVFLDCLDEDAEMEFRADPFAALADELVLKIFSYLSNRELAIRVSSVCKRFCDLARDASLWTILQLPLEKTLSLTRAHEILEGCCTQLRQLSLKRRSDADFLAMYALQHCPNLNRLELVYCEKPSSLLLETLDEHGGALRVLNLWGTGIETVVLEDNVSALRRLVNLDLFNCRGLRDEGLRAIADNCRSLESFNMEEVTLLSDEAVNYFLEGVQGTIRHLLVDGESLSDASFKNFGRCQLLETLGITFADQMQTLGLESISRLSLLSKLKIRRGKLLTGTDFVRAFTGHKLHKLQQLDLSECAGLDNIALTVIANHCPNLLHLNLDWCWDLSDDSVRCVLLRCPRLQHLELVGIIHLTSAALRDVTLLLPDLKILDLQQCPEIDDKQLEDIVSVAAGLDLTNYYGEKVTSP